MIVHYKINIRGRVQGVFFRASTLEVAKSLNLSGIVKNEPDGSLYIEVEGTRDQMEGFLKWCHKGPQLASVKEVRITQSSSLQHYQNFRIVRN